MTQANICMARYHKYLEFMGVPVYFANEGWYLMFLLAFFLACAASVYQVSSWFGLGYSGDWHVFWFRAILFVYYEIGIGSAIGLLFMYWLTLYRLFHLLTFLFAVSTGLTLHELYYPDQHRYLFRESGMVQNKFTFENPSSRGFISNWCRFIMQRFVSRPLD